MNSCGPLQRLINPETSVAPEEVWAELTQLRKDKHHVPYGRMAFKSARSMQLRSGQE